LGGAIEAPKAPRGVGVGRGVPLPTGEGAQTPPHNFFFDFGSQNGDLWCILGAFFAVQLKL